MESKITFLGTGTSQGVPMIGCTCHVCKSSDSKDKRLRSSALIEHNGFRIIIDCGPDFRQQMLREDICDADAVLLTHQHKDHTGGLDDIRAFNYFRQAAFPIYAEERVQQSLKMEYSYISSFMYGYATVCIGGHYEEENFAWKLVEGKWGIIDKTGKFIVKCIHNEEQKLSAENIIKYKKV